MTFQELLQKPWLSLGEELFISLPSVADDGPNMREIILLMNDGVIVQGDYHDDEAYRLTDFNFNGECLLKIPASLISHVHSRKEAEEIELAHDADMRLLSYAR